MKLRVQAYMGVFASIKKNKESQMVSGVLGRWITNTYVREVSVFRCEISERSNVILNKNQLPR